MANGDAVATFVSWPPHMVEILLIMGSFLTEFLIDFSLPLLCNQSAFLFQKQADGSRSGFSRSAQIHG